MTSLPYPQQPFQSQAQPQPDSLCGASSSSLPNSVSHPPDQSISDMITLSHPPLQDIRQTFPYLTSDTEANGYLPNTSMEDYPYMPSSSTNGQPVYSDYYSYQPVPELASSKARPMLVSAKTLMGMTTSAAQRYFGESKGGPSFGKAMVPPYIPPVPRVSTARRAGKNAIRPAQRFRTTATLSWDPEHPVVNPSRSAAASPYQSSFPELSSLQVPAMPGPIPGIERRPRPSSTSSFDSDSGIEAGRKVQTTSGVSLPEPAPAIEVALPANVLQPVQLLAEASPKLESTPIKLSRGRPRKKKEPITYEAVKNDTGSAVSSKDETPEGDKEGSSMKATRMRQPAEPKFAKPAARARVPKLPAAAKLANRPNVDPNEKPASSLKRKRSSKTKLAETDDEDGESSDLTELEEEEDEDEDEDEEEEGEERSRKRSASRISSDSVAGLAKQDSSDDSDTASEFEDASAVPSTKPKRRKVVRSQTAKSRRRKAAIEESSSEEEVKARRGGRRSKAVEVTSNDEAAPQLSRHAVAARKKRGRHARIPNPVPDHTIWNKARGRSAMHDPSQVDSTVVHMCPIPTCGACFKRREHVKRHIRGLHTFDKPYKCRYGECPKSFTRRDNLQLHYSNVHRLPGPKVLRLMALDTNG